MGQRHLGILENDVEGKGGVEVFGPPNFADWPPGSAPEEHPRAKLSMYISHVF